MAKKKAITKDIEDAKLEINFGSQIRSYVLQPYRIAKDHRTKVEVGDVDKVLDGYLEPFLRGYLLAKRRGTAVAAAPDRYLGMVRLVTATRQPRIGLIAVRADSQRRGIARALLAHVLGTLDRRRIATASAEVDESNAAALALFEGIGSRRTGSSLELAR